MKEVIEILTELKESDRRTHDQITDDGTRVTVSTRARLLGKIMAYERAIEEIQRYLTD
jgi:hypothetical protein